MAVSSFSQNGKYFSSITDRRIKIWDTETSVLKQEYTPDLHLSAPPSCLQWILLSNAQPRKGKKRRSSVHSFDDLKIETQQSIALGTGNGKVLIYSINQAAVETVLTDEENGAKITCLDWNENGGLLSCSKDNVVIKWDLGEAKVQNRYKLRIGKKNEQAGKIGAIKYLHQKNADRPLLLTAMCQISLWCLNSLTVLKKMVGHASDISYLSVVAFTNQNKYYAISAARKDRTLSFWDVTHNDDNFNKVTQNGDVPRKNQKTKFQEQNSPVYNFILSDGPKHITYNIDEDKNKIFLSATTTSGTVHFYGHTLNGVVLKPIKPTVTLNIQTEDNVRFPLNSSHIIKESKAANAEGGSDVLVSYEPTPGRLLFERVTLDLKNKTQVLIRENPSVEVLRIKKKDKKSKVSKVAEEINEPAVKYVEYSAPIVSLKRTAPGKAVDVPMETRLANLAIQSGPGVDSKAISENFTKLLMQGLHSDDNYLISTVLMKANAAVAKTTVAKLPAVYVPKLIEQLTQLAGNKTVKCKSASIWLNAVIQHHSSLLMATANTKTGDKISELLAVLSQRRSHLGQLLNLRGKLDLMIHQINSKDEIVDDKSINPVLDYIDISEGEDESVDLGNAEDSGNSSDEELWNEDNDIDGSKDSHSETEQKKNDEKMETDSDSD